MLQVQEKAPQAAEEASRNINKGASEVCWSLASIPSVTPAPATYPAHVAWPRSASALSSHSSDQAGAQGRLASAMLNWLPQRKSQLLASCPACSQLMPVDCLHKCLRLQVANQARPRADEVSEKVEGAARDVAQNARPMADKASEQLNAGAKSAAGKAAWSCPRAPERQQACAPVVMQRREAPVDSSNAGMWGQAGLCSIAAGADVMACRRNPVELDTKEQCLSVAAEDVLKPGAKKAADQLEQGAQQTRDQLPGAAVKASEKLNKGASTAADKARQQADNPPDLKGAAKKATDKVSGQR